MGGERATGGGAMNWRKDSSRQPDDPFDDPPERQEIREATYRVRRAEERKEALRSFIAGAKRWFVWLTAAFAFVVATSQLPDAFAKLMRFLRGGS